MSGDMSARHVVPDSFKRKCLGASDTRSPRNQAAHAHSSVLTAYTESRPGTVDEGEESSSVEALLAVPVEFIFCESRPTSAGAVTGPSPAACGVATQPPPSTPSHRRRTTLLSRSEASVLLRVNQLSAEMDILRSVASEALDRAQLSRGLRDRIERGGPTAGGRIGSAYLLPLLPLLDVHGVGVTQRAVAHVASESGRVLSELGGCASALRQFAEQNWSVSDQLCDAFGYDGDGSSSTGTGLGKEKRAVAEIEEAVSARIEGLVGMASMERGGGKGGIDAGCTDAFDVGTDKDTGHFLPMKDLCCQLLLGAGCELSKANDGAKSSVKSQPQKNVGDMDKAFRSPSSREHLCDSDHATVESNLVVREKIDEKTKRQEVSVKDNNRELPSAPIERSDKSEQTVSDAAVSTMKTLQNLGSDVGDNGVELGGSGTQDAAAALAVLASS